MITEKESQEIYMTGYREGFEEAIKCFDNFIAHMKLKKSRTVTVTTTYDEQDNYCGDKEIWKS